MSKPSNPAQHSSKPLSNSRPNLQVGRSQNHKVYLFIQVRLKLLRKKGALGKREIAFCKRMKSWGC
jgi:hypothetical protein